MGYAEGLDTASTHVVTGNFGGTTAGLDTGLLALNGELEVIPVTFTYLVELGCRFNF